MFSVWTSAAEHCELGAAAGQAGQHPQLPRRNVGWGEAEHLSTVLYVFNIVSDPDSLNPDSDLVNPDPDRDFFLKFLIETSMKAKHRTLQTCNFFIFLFAGQFWPVWIRIRIPVPDPLTDLNPDPKHGFSRLLTFGILLCLIVDTLYSRFCRCNLAV